MKNEYIQPQTSVFQVALTVSLLETSATPKNIYVGGVVSTISGDSEVEAW